MKVSFELPQEYLEWGKKKNINDYNFVLPSFYKKYTKYKEYYLNNSNIFTIMDCGLFEGDIFTVKELTDILLELKPNIFVVPDSWNNAKMSLKQAKEWLKIKKNQLEEIDIKLMAVIQCTDFKIGSNLYEKYIDLGYDCISFNHSSSAYSSFFPHSNILTSKMMGRIYFINQLLDKNIIDTTKYHHLLGCSDWKEFGYYGGKEYSFIKSIDTSCPVINGLEKIELNPLKKYIKPINPIAKYMDDNFNEQKSHLIENNVNIIKKLIIDSNE